MAKEGLPSDYPRFLSDLKERIRSAQVKAVLSVNREMIALYWEIGGGILERQKREGWGMSTVRQLSRDLALAFPHMAGFSPKNIWRMRAFYLAWSGSRSKVAQAVRLLDGPAIPKQTVSELNAAKVAQAARLSDGPLAKLPQAAAEIPWGHNIALFQKLKSRAERLWYARQTVEHGWSRSVLIHQIESGLHLRQGKALTNFKRTLPSPQSELAQETIKDDYALDFLTTASMKERDIERALVDDVQRSLLELGAGFAFVGRQHHLEIDGEDFYIDLLFYHLKLRCFVVIELKTGPFKPEHAGKMNLYLGAADDFLRHPDDQPSIGLILCKSRNKVVAEYALRDMNKPIGVASYRLTKALPAALAGRLPTTQELEARIGSAPRERIPWRRDTDGRPRPSTRRRPARR